VVFRTDKHSDYDLTLVRPYPFPTRNWIEQLSLSARPGFWQLRTPTLLTLSGVTVAQTRMELLHFHQLA
jgi:hypothetical protein